MIAKLQGMRETMLEKEQALKSSQQALVEKDEKLANAKRTIDRLTIMRQAVVEKQEEIAVERRRSLDMQEQLLAAQGLIAETPIAATAVT
eukprot:NODE_8948_length_1458_cov_2.393689.p5 GENE.NODE_8948_length_1458_cov_2.393689~~NODE_8948_length_1458_cov_2.393689.p5  ORF type:complete len:90 (+),score=30.73 NODE_8948_length_1458_cov_2.393689:1105-1374(+)